jgi:hypothetical protein
MFPSDQTNDDTNVPVGNVYVNKLNTVSLLLKLDLPSGVPEMVGFVLLDP